VALHRMQAPPLEVKPARWWTLAAWFLIWSLVAVIFYRPATGIINWYTTVIWTMSFGVGIVGIYGAVIGRRLIKEQPAPDNPVKSDEHVNVVITTVGRFAALGALTRVVASAPAMASHLTNCHIHILTDAGCEAMAEIERLARSINATLVVVPEDYRTPNGTEFKGRALQYYSDQLVARYGSIDNIPETEWNYYLDDDTAVAECTSRKYAAFIAANGPDNPERKHLAQGILAYRRQDAENLWLWRADAIRTFDDMGRFPATTASGTPRQGLHGENALWRARVDASIGWDFGPNELVEDSHKALVFCHRYPGRSAWVPARCFGAPPTSAWDFSGKQRGRWSWGMMGLALNRSIPLRERLFILHNMFVWATGIFQPVLIVAFISFMVGDFNVAPVTPWLAPFWVVSVSYTYWAYWEGLRQNALASGRKSASLWDKLLLIPGIAYFSLLEGWGGTYGAAKHFLNVKRTFDGVAKPV
jgi:egghead protein (zeste-white 4 protein)